MHDLDLTRDKVYLNISVQLINAKYLFGKTGLVYSDTVLGIGLEWKSKKSKIRHCRVLGSFSLRDVQTQITFERKNIELSELFSDTAFEWVIFIQKEGTSDSCNFFANKEGLIIGKESLWTIRSDGNASLFPIKEINDPSQPLWKIEYSSTSPFEDPFNEDYLALVLNCGHEDYKYLQSKNIEFKSWFLKEVLANALFMLINETFLCIDKRTMKDEFSENGSVVKALLYFESQYNFNYYGSSVDLMNSIKTYLDKNFNI